MSTGLSAKIRNSLVLLALFFPGVCLAQEGTVRLEAGTYSVGEIIRETESQTKCLFVYASKSFDTSNKVRIAGGEYEVSDLLDLITRDGWLYEVRRRYIVIIDEPKGPEEDPVPPSIAETVEIRQGTEFPVSVSPKARERTRPVVTPGR